MALTSLQKNIKLMVTWYSPFDLPDSLVEHLRRAGAAPVSPQELDQATAGSQLLLYRAPHQIGQSAPRIKAGYQQLDDLAKQGFGQLWNAERLERVSPAEWGGPMGAVGANHITAAIEPDPLDALVALGLIREDSDLLDAYLDLELRGVLGGHEPDSDYLERLRRASSGEKLGQGLHQLQSLRFLETRLRNGEIGEPPLVSAFEQEQVQSQLRQLEEEVRTLHASGNASQQEHNELRLQLVTSETEVNLLRKELFHNQQQLQQGQVELESLFLSDRDNRARLATYAAEREANQQAVMVAQSQLAEVEAQWQACQSQLDGVRHTLEATRQQLSDSHQCLAANEDTLNQERQALAALRSQLAQGETELEEARQTTEEHRRVLAICKAEHQTTLTAAKGQIDSLEIQRQGMQASLDAHETQLAIERQSLVDTLGLLAENETALAKEQLTVGEQALELAAKEQSLQALAETHDQTQTVLAEAEKARDRARSETVQLEKALRERTTASHRQESQLDLARQAVNRLELETKQQEACALQLQRELQQSKASMERREGQLAAARAQLHDTEENLAACLNRVSAAVQEKESSQQECTHLKAELAKNQDHQRLLEHRILELKTVLATGEQRSSQKESNIAELQSSLQDREGSLQRLQQQETGLRQQLAENSQTIDTLKVGLGACQQERDHWKQKIIEMSKIITANQEKLAQNDNQLLNMIQRHQELQEQIKQLQTDRNATELGYGKSIKEAQQINETVRQERHEVEAELNRHRQELLNKHDALEENQKALTISQDETKIQRHQVIEQQNLAAAQLQQLRRASALLWRLSSIKGVPGTGSSVPTLQLLALLESYRHSLKRAERLLKGG
jgi:chromosome segregation ATPase